MKIFSISSGSKGNSIFVSANKTKILVDAGVSYKLIESTLLKNGEDIHKVSAVLITHEHSDHIKGLSVLVKNCPQIKIYAHHSICGVLASLMPIIERNLVPIVAPIFYEGDFLISAFKVPHDSNVCLGYSIFEEDKKLSIMLDVGYIAPHHLSEVENSNLLFIESNHSIDLLKAYPGYSPNLKARILSEGGHLSNEACGEFVSKVLAQNPNCKIVLSHLSSRTNTHDAARFEVGQIIKQNIGLTPTLFIAPELKQGDIFTI